MYKLAASPRKRFLQLARTCCRKTTVVVLPVLLASCQSESPSDSEAVSQDNEADLVTVFLSGNTDTNENAASPPVLQGASSTDEESEEEAGAADTIVGGSTVTQVNPDFYIQTPAENEQELPDSGDSINPDFFIKIPEEEQSGGTESEAKEEHVPDLLSALPDPTNPNAIPIATQAGLIAETHSTADIDFSKSFFVDAVDGDNSQNGSINTPFKTIGFAQSQLTPGTTLYVRGGVYFESNIEIEASGDEDNIVSIRNFPGETVVVNGSIPEFYNVGSNNWELFDDATNTYRSTLENFDSSIYSAYAIKDELNWQRLVSYTEDSSEKSSGLDDLMSEVQHVDVNARYVGPGIYNDSGRLYVRLEPLKDEVVLNRDILDIGLPLNPNEISISIGSSTPVIRIAASHVTIEGLTLTGGAKGILIEPTAANVVLRNNTYLGLSVAVLAEEGVANLEIDHSLFDARFPDYIAWTDMKGTDGQSKPAAYWMNKLAGLGAKDIDNLKFTNNYFVDIFDGMVVSGSNLEISGNAGFFVDDFAQVGSNSSNVRVFDNRISGAGPSHYGRGNSPEPGTIYVYQNVIETAREILWGKYDPQNILRDGYSGWGEQQPFQSHAKSAVVDGDPWKIYNNTVVFNSLSNGFGIGIEIFGEENSTGVSHAVYNNIFVETGGGIYTKDMDITVADQIYDGNIYWSEVTPQEPIFSSMQSSSLGSSHFDTLTEFRASDYFDETVSLFGVGWEVNGLQADPQLSVSLVPAASSSASTTNVSLPASFPNSDMQYRGAISPE